LLIPSFFGLQFPSTNGGNCKLKNGHHLRIFPYFSVYIPKKLAGGNCKLKNGQYIRIFPYFSYLPKKKFDGGNCKLKNGLSGVDTPSLRGGRKTLRGGRNSKIR